MKRSKRLFVLLGVLAVACLAMGIALHVEQQQEEIRNSGETVLEINADTVESLSWEYDGASFRFLYKGIIINHNKNRASLH